MIASYADRMLWMNYARYKSPATSSSSLCAATLLSRYKRSVLGVAWTMLNPLGMMLVLSLAFYQVVKTNIVGYPVFVLTGLMGWNFFSQTTSASMVNLVWGGGLLRQIYIPRSAFALAAMGTGLVNIAFSFVPLVIVLLFTGLPIHWSILSVPIPTLCLLFFSLGIGLLISTWAIFFPRYFRNVPDHYFSLDVPQSRVCQTTACFRPIFNSGFRA